MALWTSTEAVKATGGTSAVGWSAEGVSIDTRALRPGDLFVALKDVRLVGRKWLIKTSSGKIRRAASREFYEQGKIGRPPRAVWRQWVRLAASGWLRQARQGLRQAASTGTPLRLHPRKW